MMAKHLYKKFFNIIFGSLFFLLILLNQNVFSKPIPPGSGEGDVPANILILLDSSASMRNKIIAGDGIENPGDVVETGDGNLIIGEGRVGFATTRALAGDRRRVQQQQPEPHHGGGSAGRDVQSAHAERALETVVRYGGQRGQLRAPPSAPAGFCTRRRTCAREDASVKSIKLCKK